VKGVKAPNDDLTEIVDVEEISSEIEDLLELNCNISNISNNQLFY
jgi:hypothetical protein